MSVILLVLGILITGAGVVAIGFGISNTDPGLGNALIIAGTTAASAGVILIGLAEAVGQLTKIAQALRPRAGVRPVIARPTPPAKSPILAKAKAAEPNILERVPEPPPAGEPAPELSASVIERLRSSLVRPDRRAAEGTEAEDAPLSPGTAVPGTQGGAGANGAAPSGGAGAVEVLKKPGLDFLFRSKPRDLQSESFDSVWPKRGARQADDEANSNEPATLAAGEEAAPIERPRPPEAPPASAPEEARPAAILKSGVVDGMAYTLYVDGSIEAQLPQGTVRFGSIAELRAHIENNS